MYYMILNKDEFHKSPPIKPKRQKKSPRTLAQNYLQNAALPTPKKKVAELSPVALELQRRQQARRNAGSQVAQSQVVIEREDIDASPSK